MISFLITQPYGSRTLGAWLTNHFVGAQYSDFYGVSAFVQRSGVDCIRAGLLQFCADGGTANFVVGVDMHGTSYEGLQSLLDLAQQAKTCHVWVCNNPRLGAFHPKGYAFEGNGGGAISIGSGNLTAGGLYRNYELTLAGEGSPTPSWASDFIQYFRNLTMQSETTLPLDTGLLDYLLKARFVVSEAEARANTEGGAATKSANQPGSTSARFSGWRPNRLRQRLPGLQEGPPAVNAIRRFVMTLQRTDVGVGQVQPGTARRSPELFIPLAALRSDPGFWRWDKFVADPSWTGRVDSDGKGKMDRNGVKILLGASVITANLFYNPRKGDLRIRAEELRSSGSIGDILELEAVRGTPYEYIARIIPQTSVAFAHAQVQCVNLVRNSKKSWGYY